MDAAGTIEALEARIPDYAKDIRLNLDAVILRSSLEPADALGCALAAAFAAKSRPLIEALRATEGLPATESAAALAAAALMAMNNVWYPFVEMAADPDLASQRPELRMNVYASHGGADARRFELYALAASIVGKCRHCVGSRFANLRKAGMTAQQLRDAGRIAAVVVAAAAVLAVEEVAG